jgi:transcriptional regulator with XRE-family HTH domain
MSTEKSSELNTFTQRFFYIIDKIKDKYGINQTAISKELGLSTAALSQLKNGDSKSAAGTTLSALENKFLVNTEWLNRNEGEPFLKNIKIGVEKREIGAEEGTVIYSEIDYSSLSVHIQDVDLTERQLKNIRHWIYENTEQITTLKKQIHALEMDKRYLQGTIDTLYEKVDDQRRKITELLKEHEDPQKDHLANQMQSRPKISQ